MMKNQLSASLVIIFVVSVSYSCAQVSSESELSITANYNWRYYNYEGHYLQWNVDYASDSSRLEFGGSANCNLKLQVNQIELTPSILFRALEWEKSQFAIGFSYYLASPAISSESAISFPNDFGELYGIFEYTGRLNWNISLYLNAWNYILYQEQAIEFSTWKRKRHELVGQAIIGLQLGDTDYKQGVTHVEWSLIYKFCGKKHDVTAGMSCIYFISEQHLMVQQTISISL